MVIVLCEFNDKKKKEEHGQNGLLLITLTKKGIYFSEIFGMQLCFDTYCAVKSLIT